MNFKNLIPSAIFTISFIAGLQSASAQGPRPVPPVYSPSTPLNFVRVWEASGPVNVESAIVAGSLQTAKQSTIYMDGLGRQLQTVKKQGSLETSTAILSDLVSPVQYDEMNRESFIYIPFVSTAPNSSGQDGSFKYNPFQQQANFLTTEFGPQNETFYYSKIGYEAQPNDQISQIFPVGNSWVGSNRGKQIRYWSNTITDDVKIFNVTDQPNDFGQYSMTGIYAPGTLFKKVTIDENGNQLIEFTDKDKKIILKKVQIGSNGDTEAGTGYTDWFCTYYIYDDFNNLRCVVQPEAVKAMAPPTNNWVLSSTALAEQCFRFAYDSRNRMVMKQVPGAAPVQMIYDERDRVVMMQDGNLRAAHQWLYTQYDALNRTVATGTITDNAHYNDPGYHRSLAAGSMAYPALSNYPTNELLTQTFYDDYSWLPAAGNPFSNTYSTSYDSYFETVSSTAWPYGQANTQSTATKGATTGTKTKILGTSNYTYSISYYDAKGRVIQTKATNITGGIDVSTTQYTWAGLPLVSVMRQERQGTGAQATVIVSRNTYDDLGRLSRIEKKMSNTLVNGGAMTAYKATLANEYDKLGQLKVKALSPDQSTAGPLEKEKYEYNIRGWLLGMNRGYAKDESTDNYFGFDLGYDKTANSLIANQSYAAPQFTGNIAGTVWKSRGDGEKRKYDFIYDRANRLTAADFNQYTNGTFNKDANVDFSVTGLSYDANGNIASMNQKGLKLTSSPFIDQLTYSYIPGTNKLKSVTDAVSGTDNGKLGDFKDGGNVGDDYTYDNNGNMQLDNNKGISSIQYNYLNLPQLITITGKGTIAYTYDAGGNKLKKVTIDNSTPGKTITTTTDYLSGFIYESKSTMPADANSPDYAGVLQFTGHEEGRIRLKPTEGADPAKFVCDYFLKDHLGNVRSVITDDLSAAKHYAASFEVAVRTYEDALFANIDETAFPATGLKEQGVELPPFPDCYGCIFFPGGTPPGGIFSGVPGSDVNDYVSRLNGNGRKIGATLALKVSAGDKIDLGTYAWYPDASPTTSSEPDQDALSALLTAMSGNAPVLTGGAHTAAEMGNSTNGLLLPGLITFLSSHTQPVDDMHDPKTYINWVLFDDNFNYVPEGSGFIQAKITSNEVQALTQSLVLPKNGFFFVYLSNETEHFDVFFDQLVVNHTPSAILEETHYYPFGLTMAGISSKAAGGITNRDKYNGKELQSTEFSDGTGLELYDYGARMYDMQIGRWNVQDNKSYKYFQYSPYGYALNNPIRFIDPDGNEIIDKTLDARTKTVLDKLRKTTTASKQLSPFEGAAAPNYTFNSAKLEDPGTWGVTNNERRGSKNIKTDINSDNSQGYDKSYPDAGFKYNYTATDIGIAYALEHEIVHGMILEKRANGDKSVNANPDDPEDHEIMANQYRSEIVNSLTEYNESEKLGLTKENIEAISWAGLQDTAAFKKVYDTKEKQDQWKKDLDSLLTKKTYEKIK